MTLSTMDRTDETHACCGLPTVHHLTTCHYCGDRAEIMRADLTGEPICGTCATQTPTECPWTCAEECATAQERRVAGTDLPAIICPQHGGAA